MRASILGRWKPACLVLVSLLLLAPWALAYVNSTGSRPEVQAIRTVNTQTKTIDNTFEICADTDHSNPRYGEIAEILKEELSPHVSLSIVDDADLDKDVNQIVIGDATTAAFADLATTLKLNTIDLGEEGYNLVCEPNPSSTNGSWIMFIYAPDTRGLFRGIQNLMDRAIGGSSLNPVGNIWVRDYPDRPYRAFQYALGSFGTSKTSWLNDRKSALRQIARTGCNVLYIVGADAWWRMSEEVAPGQGTYGEWLTEFAEWARYYGMEPVPTIYPVPSNIAWSHPLWREGELIEDEPFLVVSDGQGGYVLEPENRPFDNEAHNMDLDQCSGSWPDFWVDTYHNGSYSQVGGDGIVSYNTADAIVFYQQFQDAAEFVAGSLYVLEVLYDFASAGDMTLAVEADDVVNNEHLYLWQTFLPKGADLRKDFYFWTPPTRQTAPAGYAGRYFEDLANFQITFVRYNSGPNIDLSVSRLFLERRAASLRNVMYGADLPFMMKYADTGLPVGPNYQLQWVQPEHYRMPTYDVVRGKEYISAVSCTDCSPDVGRTILISYTSGVPADWSNGGQMTTFCLNNSEMLESLEGALRNLYEEFQGLAFSPKYIDLHLSELLGMNRCGRCTNLEQQNSEYLVEYLNAVQGMLDGIAATCPPAADTRLTVWSDMFNPCHNGGNPGYQYETCGGQWGISSGGLGALNSGEHLIIDMWGLVPSQCARDLNWPGCENPDLSVVASRNGQNDEGPGLWANNSTWYADDCLGFYAYDYTTSLRIPDEDDAQMLDYAWKRYSQPDATLHAYSGGFYATDELGGHVVNLEVGRTQKFYPFGYVEMRNSVLQGQSIIAATIDWGIGAPENVLGKLNKQVANHIFQYANTYNVTLAVTSSSPYGLPPVTKEATVVVQVYDPDPPDPENPVSPAPEVVISGIHDVSPNPFNPMTTIHFGLKEAGAVRLDIFDVQGKRVATLLDGSSMPSGNHSVTWTGRGSSGSQVASGIYFVRLAAEGQMHTKKIVLLR